MRKTRYLKLTAVILFSKSRIVLMVNLRAVRRLEPRNKLKEQDTLFGFAMW